MEYTFSAKMWEYGGQASWHFVTLPKEYVEEIRLVSSDKARGFGSVRVSATVGDTTWQTSIFPDKKSGSYLLPIKKEVRAKENLDVSHDFEITLEIK